MDTTAAIFAVAVLVPVAASLAAIPLKPWPRLQTAFGAGGAITGAVAGLYCAVQALLSPAPATWNAPWSMPLGSLSMSMDALSALFLIPLFVLFGLGALYAVEYLRPIPQGRNAAIPWFYYNTLGVSMALVVVAANGLLFLVSWEIMSLSSFACVLHDHEKEGSREAAWIYLIATHIGAAFLLIFFLVAGAGVGSLDFSSIARHTFSPALSGLLFAIGLVGFGSKAGFVPFHVWLPKAHPAAPSHVSALMSGIMIKMGIYGILRSMTLLGHVQAWWGFSLIAIGSVSGVLGVLLALGQHDLKRLLAYHSVENVGIIALGLGAGVLGVSYGIPQLAFLGFCGALLHVVNHAFFKGLLFLGAGSVIHATGTADIDALGGLIRKMPLTAAGFLVGSVAICGLPPLNGFVSEFLVYAAAIKGIGAHNGPVFAMCALSVASLALIGGLAVACFTKAFGTVFLGEPRTAAAAHGEAGPYMVIPLFVLAAFCGIIGLAFWKLVPVFAQPVCILTSLPKADVVSELSTFAPSLSGIAIGCVLFLACTGAVYLLRNRLLNKRTVGASPTWDCGYTVPGPRIQYTASSFAQPIVLFFRHVLGPVQTKHMPASTFPKGWSFHSHVPDLLLDNVYTPMFRLAGGTLSKLRWLQGGRTQAYVLYITITLIALLLWNFVWPR
jgi:hydrogenase-4 component B